MWSEAMGEKLSFEEYHPEPDSLSNHKDFDIFFARYDHGDHEPFDGRGGVVAHSGYPMEGKVHFDASEAWSATGKNGVDLTYVTLHEFGHALGLRHSVVPTAIMHPIYQRTSNTITLSDDDIGRIRRLYHP